MGKILAQSTVASDQLVSEAENLESQVNVEPKHLSTPVNNPTHSKVHIANGSNSHFTSSPLADTQSAPTKTTIMEEIPSPVIVFETNLVSMDNSLVSPHSHAHDSPPTNQIAHIVQDDGEGSMSEATANLNMSRGGRPIKPLQKFQDME